MANSVELIVRTALRPIRFRGVDDVTYFRASAAGLIVNDEGLVLALERIDVPGSWQAPQGGIRWEEEPIDAVLREVEEETGITSDGLTLLQEYPDWLVYVLPREAQSRKTGRGQAQRWFLFRSATDPELGPESDAKDLEFASWRWMPMADLTDNLWEPRRHTYQLLASAWKDWLP